MDLSGFHYFPLVEGREFNLQNRDHMLDQGPLENGGQTVRDRIIQNLE